MERLKQFHTTLCTNFVPRGPVAKELSKMTIFLKFYYIPRKFTIFQGCSFAWLTNSQAQILSVSPNCPNPTKINQTDKSYKTTLENQSPNLRKCSENFNCQPAWELTSV